MILSIFIIVKLNDYLVIIFPSNKNMTIDPIIATLIGAFIGGVIAFYGSVYVQQAQIKAQAALHRRDIVYIPLYNELKSLKDKLEIVICPYSIALDRTTSDRQPSFIIWSQIQQDSRLLQVPVGLQKSLNEFIQTVKNYIENKDIVNSDDSVKLAIRNVVVSNLGEKHSRRSDLVEYFLPCNSNLQEIVQRLYLTIRSS